MDRQRQAAVVLGERDVASDVKEDDDADDNQDGDRLKIGVEIVSPNER